MIRTGNVWEYLGHWLQTQYAFEFSILTSFQQNSLTNKAAEAAKSEGTNVTGKRNMFSKPHNSLIIITCNY